jgi:2-polyprenyl-3-methyl-5-hydroxy-6-metoxy-1,4-benzoquinol methylase
MLRNRLDRAAIYSTSEYWNLKADEFDEHAVSMWPNQRLNALYHQEQLELALARLGDVRGKRILDVGCGSGRISRHLAGLGAQVVGFDFAERVIEVARRMSAAGNPSYRVGSVFELDEVEQYDIVVCWGVLTVACRDATDLGNALGRLRRALKPDGALLLVEPIHRGFLHRVLDLDVHEFVQVMGRAGFRVHTVDQLHFWPARLALAFWPLPDRLTELGYRVGQWLLRRLPRRLPRGDYRGISATASGHVAAPTSRDAVAMAHMD